MTNNNIPFQLIDWTRIEPVEHKGATGLALWKTFQIAGLRIRIVEYSEGYLADHWCKKGHIVHCIKGNLITEHEDGQRFSLQEGMTYVVSDDMSSHRSIAKQAVMLLIVDGEFLNFNGEK
jgi:mannose-6-phosphate isomerase class I